MLAVVTGFGAFDDVADNPSGRLAQALGERDDVVAVELPVSFRRSAEVLDATLEGLSQPPAVILAMGVQPDDAFHLESRARASLREDRPDNDGVCGDTLGGTGADLTTRADLHALEAALVTAGGVPTAQSDDAGRYVCERIYRRVLEHAEALDCLGLFLHVPPLDDRPLDAQLPVAAACLDELLRQAR